MRVEWFPPSGSGPVVFGDGGAIIMALDGVSSVRTEPETRRAPGQRGVSVLDRTMTGRTVAMQVDLHADDVPGFHAAWAQLVSALAGEPSLSGPPKLGTLRVHRPGMPTVETFAEPVDSPQEALRKPTSSVVDIEWLCPSPLWWESNERALILDQTIQDPWTSPWESPWTAQAATATGEVDNPGDVPADMKVRFWGPSTGHRLVNDTTGEYMRVNHGHGAGEYVEVDTAARTVMHHGMMGPMSMLGKWDWDGTWWRIGKGHNVIRTESDMVGAGARTVVIWRPAYSGI